MINQKRLDTLIERMRAQGLDCAILVPGHNLFYLTGLTMGLSERPTVFILPIDGPPSFIAPGFEAARVESMTGIKDIITYTDDEGPVPAFKAVDWRRLGKRYAVEYQAMRLLEFHLLAPAIGSEPEADIGAVLAELRSRKDPDEIRSMTRAASIADKAVRAGLEAVSPGVSERTIDGVIRDEIRRQGATGDQLVASGPRTAQPHSGTSDRIILDGDAVWIDIVVQYERYYSDITRSGIAGDPDPTLEKIYAIVHDAQRLGRTMVRPGLTCGEVDDICREFIIKAGFGDNFIHRTGHGIGLEIHEEPYIVRGNDTRLEPGMTFTIEPGIYVPDVGGIRIEDTMVITGDGARSLTECPRDPGLKNAP